MSTTLEDAVVAERERHAGKGHTDTTNPYYCGESDGVSAVYCVEGFFLRALAAHEVAEPAGRTWPKGTGPDYPYDAIRNPDGHEVAEPADSTSTEGGQP